MKMLMSILWYGCILVGVLIISFIIYKTAPFLKEIRRVLKSKSFEKNPLGIQLPLEEQNWLNVGAINGEQTSSYIDSLETGIQKDRLSKGLYQWNINNANSALTILNWLTEEGHRVHYMTIYSVFKNARKVDSSFDELKALCGDSKDFQKCAQFLKNFQNTYPNLVKEGYTENDFTNGILAWDTGRLVLLARMCYDAQLIDEETAWRFIQKAYNISKEKFSSWEQFAKSYIIGRAMWGGNTMMLDGIKSIAEDLLHKKESPWFRLPL